MKTGVILILIVAILLALGIYFAGADELGDFCCLLLVGDSLRDVVRESEGGQMPSREEMNRRGVGDAEAEMHLRDQPVSQPPEAQTEPEVAPPQAPDAGGPGRVLVPSEPRPVLSAWGFVAWLPDGRLFKPAGGLFDDADTCAQARSARRQQAPHLRLSPCTLLEIGERERL